VLDSLLCGCLCGCLCGLLGLAGSHLSLVRLQLLRRHLTQLLGAAALLRGHAPRIRCSRGDVLLSIRLSTSSCLLGGLLGAVRCETRLELGDVLGRLEEGDTLGRELLLHLGLLGGCRTLILALRERGKSGCRCLLGHASHETLEGRDLRLDGRESGEDSELAHLGRKGRQFASSRGTYGWPAGHRSIFFAGAGR